MASPPRARPAPAPIRVRVTENVVLCDGTLHSIACPEYPGGGLRVAEGGTFEVTGQMPVLCRRCVPRAAILPAGPTRAAAPASHMTPTG